MGSVVRAAAVSTVAVALTIGLSACVGSSTAPASSAAPSSAPSGTSTKDPGAAPSPTPPAAPVYVPGGTAEENRAIFDLANQKYFIQAGNVIPAGRGVIDNLVNVGFDKKDMQITPDRTAIDLPVDSLIFSVLQGDKCLIGQYSAVGYGTIIAPKLTTGSCLIGLTRAIDW